MKDRVVAALAFANQAQVAASRVEVLVEFGDEDYVSDSDGNGYRDEEEGGTGTRTEGTEGEVEGDEVGQLTQTRMGYNGDDEVYAAMMGKS